MPACLTACADGHGDSQSSVPPGAPASLTPALTRCCCCRQHLICIARYSRDQAQAELEDVAEQLRKEEEMRMGLDEQVLQLQRDLESAKSDLTTTRATAAKAAAGGGTAAAVGAGAARSAGGAAANGVDSARLVELEGLLSARTNELQETNARCASRAAPWTMETYHQYKRLSPQHAPATLGCTALHCCQELSVCDFAVLDGCSRVWVMRQQQKVHIYHSVDVRKLTSSCLFAWVSAPRLCACCQPLLPLVMYAGLRLWRSARPRCRRRRS